MNVITDNTKKNLDLINENVAAVSQTPQASQELASLAVKQAEELPFFAVK